MREISDSYFNSAYEKGEFVKWMEEEITRSAPVEIFLAGHRARGGFGKRSDIDVGVRLGVTRQDFKGEDTMQEFKVGKNKEIKIDVWWHFLNDELDGNGPRVIIYP